ncbi:MAG: SMI1/KNR4 family protein [Burkholderiaceae bacterium]
MSAVEVFRKLILVVEKFERCKKLQLTEPLAKNHIEDLEKQFGFQLPSELRDIYSLHDGESEDSAGLFFGMHFLPLREAYDQFKFGMLMAKTHSSDAAIATLGGFGSTPDQTVQAKHFVDRRIPFATDYSGNYIAIDQLPGEKGIQGQVIGFDHEKRSPFYQLSNSLTEFLEFTLRQYELGRGHPEHSADGSSGSQMEDIFGFRDGN